LDHSVGAVLDHTCIRAIGFAIRRRFYIYTRGALRAESACFASAPRGHFASPVRFFDRVFSGSIAPGIGHLNENGPDPTRREGDDRFLR
jgi:hypothetical protein